MITSKVVSRLNSIFPRLQRKGSSSYPYSMYMDQKMNASSNTDFKFKERKEVVRAVEYPSPSFNNYEFHPLIYTGEIGQISDYTPRIITFHPEQEDVIRESPDLYMYKYGITSNIQRRMRENDRQFKYFDVKLLKGSIRHMEIEKCMTDELKIKKLLFNIMMNGKIRREIICFNEEWQKEWYVHFIDDLIRKQYTNHKFVNQNWLNE